MFNWQRIADNISILIRIRNLKVKDVENAVGDSAGCLSRLLRKDYTKGTPPVDLIFNLAKYFGVSTDMLIEDDFSKVPDDMLYFVPFLNWLKSMTEYNQLRWECFPPYRVDLMLLGQEEVFFLVQETNDVADLATNIVKTCAPIPCESRDTLNHSQITPPAYDDAIVKHRIKTDWGLGKHWAYENRRIISHFYTGNKVWLTNTGYRCGIDRETRVSLFPMAVELINPAYQKDNYSISQTFCPVFYEIYFEKRDQDFNHVSSPGSQAGKNGIEWNVYPICNTSLNAAGLWSSIFDLYNVIVRCNSNLVLDETVRGSINKFMNARPGLSF